MYGYLSRGGDVATEAQKRANAKYKREKVKQVVVTFSPQDTELYEWLCAQPSKAGTIKRLLREEMGRSSG